MIQGAQMRDGVLDDISSTSEVAPVPPVTIAFIPDDQPDSIMSSSTSTDYSISVPTYMGETFFYQIKLGFSLYIP